MSRITHEGNTTVAAARRALSRELSQTIRVFGPYTGGHTPQVQRLGEELERLSHLPPEQRIDQGH